MFLVILHRTFSLLSNHSVNIFIGSVLAIFRIKCLAINIVKILVTILHLILLQIFCSYFFSLNDNLLARVLGRDQLIVCLPFQDKIFMGQ